MSNDTIIVVGAGLSGGSCALTILEAGGHVTFVEKEKRLGGNSVRASSGINAALTHHQKDQGVGDSVAVFSKDTAYSMFKDVNAEATPLVRTLCENSADAVSWLEDHKLKLPVLSQCAGHSFPRTHRPTSGAAGGYITLGLMRAIKKYAKKGQCTIIKQAKLEGLLKGGNGNVNGISYTNLKDGSKQTLTGKAVVIATGGFCFNKALLHKYARVWEKLGTTNGPWAQGEGMLVAEKDAGASLVDMECVQVHPTGFIDPQDPDAHEKTLAAECLRASGALLINREGHRFTNELAHRDEVTAAERGQPGRIRLVLNPIAVAQVEPHVRMYTNHFKVLKIYKNGYDLAKEMGVSPSALQETFDDYNASAKRGWSPCGKPRFPGVPYKMDQELRVGFVEPVLHYVMGGIAIDTQARALRKDGTVIEGLYACGETTGGVHGRNRLAGNSLVDCVVYGRVAGKSVVDFAGISGGPIRSRL